jgi:23S rRNA G2445 N2-methylase RlmL
MIASRIPPGYLRPIGAWGFTHMEGFDVREFAKIKLEEDSKIIKVTPFFFTSLSPLPYLSFQTPKGPHFIGTEKDEETMNSAIINAKNAGVSISFYNQDFTDSKKVKEVRKGERGEKEAENRFFIYKN